GWKGTVQVAYVVVGRVTHQCGDRGGGGESTLRRGKTAGAFPALGSGAQQQGDPAMPESTGPLPRALEERVLEILELSAEHRQAPLDELYAAHPEHAPRIQRRLARAGDLLGGLDRAFAAVDPVPQRPEWIGPYRVLEQLGEGGMGTVWLAEQHEPVRRRVAVKVIKAGADSRQVLARFALERQALAMMNHDNIARVFDA